MINYTTLLGKRFASLLKANRFEAFKVNALVDAMQMNNSNNTNQSLIFTKIEGQSIKDNTLNASESTLNAVTTAIDFERSSPTEDTEEMLLNVLLSEAQGGITVNAKLSDLKLAVSELRPLDARQRFRLGVGLAKLGLFDLSLRHVSLSATPWEAPLYRFRAKLVFSPVHASVRALAQAVDSFVRQSESILMQPTPRSILMIQICNSPNEAALALQALPLLHLAGLSAPRGRLWLGHAPVALPVLLSEVFLSMCPASPPAAHLQQRLLASSAPLAQSIPSGGLRAPEVAAAAEAHRGVANTGAMASVEFTHDSTRSRYSIDSNGGSVATANSPTGGVAPIGSNQGGSSQQYQQQQQGGQRQSRRSRRKDRGGPDAPQGTEGVVVIGIVAGSMDTTLGRVVVSKSSRDLLLRCCDGDCKHIETPRHISLRCWDCFSGYISYSLFILVQLSYWFRDIPCLPY